MNTGRSVYEQVQGSGLDTSLRRNVMPRTLQVADIAGMRARFTLTPVDFSPFRRLEKWMETGEKVLSPK